jgi:hypothetical protein
LSEHVRHVWATAVVGKRTAEGRKGSKKGHLITDLVRLREDAKRQLPPAASSLLGGRDEWMETWSGQWSTGSIEAEKGPCTRICCGPSVVLN